MKKITLYLCAIAALSLATISYADPNASTFSGYPIYACDTTKSACLNTVNRKVNAVIRKGGNPYSYAYTANTRTAELKKYRVMIMFEDGDKIARVMKVSVDSHAASIWRPLNNSFADLNNAVPASHSVAALNTTSSLFLVGARLFIQILVTPAFAGPDDSCDNTEFDGSPATASAADFASNSDLRQQAFDDMNFLQTTVLALTGIFDLLVKWRFHYWRK